MRHCVLTTAWRWLWVNHVPRCELLAANNFQFLASYSFFFVFLKQSLHLWDLFSKDVSVNKCERHRQEFEQLKSKWIQVCVTTRWANVLSKLELATRPLNSLSSGHLDFMFTSGHSTAFVFCLKLEINTVNTHRFAKVIHRPLKDHAPLPLNSSVPT